jgi:predicted nucleic acid-binding protein
LLLDSSALIYFLTGVQAYFDLLVPYFQRVQSRQATMVVSAVTESELLVRPFRDRDAEAIERIADLLSEDGIEVIEVDRAIARRAAQLRAGHMPLRLPDAMIIATALDAGCDLVLGNDGEWSKLKGVPFARLDDIIKE